jgi:uncharacterized protein
VTWGDALAILGGLAAGILSGFIGIGGGTAFVPIMTVGFRFNQALAQGTSLAAIIPTAIVGGITHLREGNVLIGPALWMGGGGAGGAILGALLAVHVPGLVLARVWGVFLVFMAFRLGQGVWKKGKAVKAVPPA